MEPCFRVSNKREFKVHMGADFMPQQERLASKLRDWLLGGLEKGSCGPLLKTMSNLCHTVSSYILTIYHLRRATRVISMMNVLNRSHQILKGGITTQGLISSFSRKEYLLLPRSCCFQKLLPRPVDPFSR
ncbi:hypothetical protein MPTK1_8g09580 [Marchantia polymorpha subsp. ruderalis]|uniref:Uncharacterized protein n=1 Tax=Marchantia polymorpha TaxID=3197 RepID=A0A2R6XN37_MARPO|nr:hypothetical protein MARPO_0008s0266 [Marchantia polymorpha]BBN19311.1 hypothetical protein Mp_8g09580 [Marchantia polymorpha subsp. ruderalis]|eukprot:PTQ47525.1 hypothetical protein MARPO_0008s0266 [Marchantia polymorpha]